MKIHRLWSLTLAILSVFCTCNAHENIGRHLSEHNCVIAQKEDKIYINPEAIVIYGNEIYLSMDNNPISVSALFSDGEGIYISKKKEQEDKKRTWICPTCGYENPMTSPICQNYAAHKFYEPDNR